MTTDRRTILTAALAAIASPLLSRGALAQAAMSRITAYAFSFQALAGGDIRLGDYAGRPLMIVNTASLCGFTPQYAGLQQLWTEFHDRGLMIVGVGLPEDGGTTTGIKVLRMCMSGSPVSVRPGRSGPGG